MPVLGSLFVPLCPPVPHRPNVFSALQYPPAPQCPPRDSVSPRERGAAFHGQEQFEGFAPPGRLGGGNADPSLPGREGEEEEEEEGGRRRREVVLPHPPVPCRGRGGRAAAGGGSGPPGGRRGRRRRGRTDGRTDGRSAAPGAQRLARAALSPAGELRAAGGGGRCSEPGFVLTEPVSCERGAETGTGQGTAGAGLGYEVGAQGYDVGEAVVQSRGAAV